MPRTHSIEFSQINEYLNLIAYFRTRLDLKTRCELVRSCASELLRTLKPRSTATIMLPGVLESDVVNDISTQQSRHRTIEYKGLSYRDPSCLDALLSPPAGTQGISVISERMNPNSNDYSIIYSVEYDEPHSSTHSGSVDEGPVFSVSILRTLFDPIRLEDKLLSDGQFLTCEEHADPRARHLVAFFMEAVANVPDLVCGNVELVPDIETSSSAYYHDINFMRRTIPWHRQMEHSGWQLAGESRHNYVRRVTWGTLVGPSIMSRLNRGGSWAESFRDKHWTRRYPTPDYEWITKYSSGAVLFAAGDNPLSVAPSESAGIGLVKREWESAYLLHRELHREGVLLY